MTDVNSPVTKLEQRIWLGALGICGAVVSLLAGWWMQNQYDTILRLQAQNAETVKALQDFGKFVDQQYVEKEFLREVTAQQYRRFDQIDRKLDKVWERLDRPHSHGSPQLERPQ